MDLIPGKKHSVHDDRHQVKLPFDWRAQQVILSNGEGGFERAYTFKKSGPTAIPQNTADFGSFLKNCIQEVKREQQRISRDEGYQIGYEEGLAAGKDSKFSRFELVFKSFMAITCLGIMVFLSVGLVSGQLIGYPDNLDFTQSRILIIGFIVFMGMLTAALAFGHGAVERALSAISRLSGIGNRSSGT